MKILIRDTQILTVAGAEPELISGSIAIENDTIIAVGKIPADFEPDKVIDGTDTLTMPGLINAHTHMPMSLLRNFGNDLDLMDWLETAIFPAEDRMDEECAYYGSLLSAAELIRSGCTAFEEQYMFPDAIARATEVSGIRGNISRGLIGDGKSQGSLERLEENKQAYEKWHGKADGRIRVDFGPHAPFTCENGILEKIVETVAELPDAGIHIHLCETMTEVNGCMADYGVTPVRRMEEVGLFTAKRVVAAHGVHLTEADMEILSSYPVHVVHNPSSNLKLASGFAKVQELLNRGINVALGTDGSASNNNLNMMEELHLAALLAKAVAGDAKALPAYEAVKMATINGAKALGIDHLTGTLEPGKKADLAVIDMTGAHWYPRTDLIAALVYAAQASDVRDVICNGQILMEDRNILTFDEQYVKEKVQLLSEKVLRG